MARKGYPTLVAIYVIGFLARPETFTEWLVGIDSGVSLKHVFMCKSVDIAGITNQD
jgi:hypothetical protein